MNLFWSNNPAVPNFGDDINPWVFSRIFNSEARYSGPGRESPHVVGIGSILHYANGNSIIVGTGFIRERDDVVSPPSRIVSVRGRLTRDKLLRSGIKCPEAYGDMALLLPEIYNPSIKKTHKLGIIPHYIDKCLPCLSDAKEKMPEAKIIDIQNTNHLELIDEILSCELIASSTLHGIIVADAYGIPTAWLEFSENVIGNGFKFRDYFSSVGTDGKEPLRIGSSIEPQKIYDRFDGRAASFDRNGLRKLVSESMEKS